MRVIKRCRPREGLQAALELTIPVDCILRNGLVIKFDDEERELQWQARYFDICAQERIQWKLEEWNERGYTLILLQRQGYRKSRLVPKLIHNISTL